MKKQKILKRIEITKEKEIKARQNLQESPLEKKDVFAMIIAAFITFVIPTLIVVGVIALIMWIIISLVVH